MNILREIKTVILVFVIIIISKEFLKLRRTRFKFIDAKLLSIAIAKFLLHRDLLVPIF